MKNYNTIRNRKRRKKPAEDQSLSQVIEEIKNSNQLIGVSSFSPNDHLRSETALTIKEIEEEFFRTKGSLIDKERKDLAKELASVYKGYIDNNVCNVVIECPKQLYNFLIIAKDKRVEEWIALIDFWQRRIYFLFHSVNEIAKIKAGEKQAEHLALVLDMMKEEDETLVWGPILRSIFDFIDNAESTQATINRLKENLYRCRESLLGHKAAERFKAGLESLYFPEKLKPTRHFKYTLARKINEKSENADQEMFNYLDEQLFSGLRSNEAKVTVLSALNNSTFEQNSEANILLNNSHRLDGSQVSDHASSLNPAVLAGGVIAACMFVGGAAAVVARIYKARVGGCYNFFTEKKAKASEVNSSALEEAKEKQPLALACSSV